MRNIYPIFALLLMATIAHAGPGTLEASARLPKLPFIGEQAYDFEAETTHGRVRFPDDYRGKWVILFSHPGDFTPVCTSEFIELAAAVETFEQINTQLLGLSVDSVSRHRAWTAAIGKLEYRGTRKPEIPFPIVADADGEIAWRYGMIHPKTFSDRTVRAVFIIDPHSTIRAVLYYPAEVGRSIAELERLVIALQTSDKHRVVTPADWQPGDDVLVPTSRKRSEADEARVKHPKARCQDWFFCSQPMPASELTLPKS